MELNYRANEHADLRVARGTTLTTVSLQQAVGLTHRVLEHFAVLKRDMDVDTFALLGMRNLSGFIGEVFSSSLIKSTGDRFIKNPHQDGYPDLLLMDEAGQVLWDNLKGRLRDKKPFSPFETGGVEVKATCGSVPTPEICARRDKEKPTIGDQRVDMLTGYDWKAHHRDTNNLIGLFWDFVSGVPTIVALFYSTRLDLEDWGAIVQPRAGGGRTTSVSVMQRNGVRKMHENWVLVIDDQRYATFFNRYNNPTRGLNAGRPIVRI